MNKGQRRSVGGVTEIDRARIAAEMSSQLHRVVAAIDRGELAASATLRAYLEGAVVALDAISSADPVSALAELADSFDL